MALLPTDAEWVRAVAEAAAVSLFVCFAFCCFIVALSVDGKFHYREFTCERSAPYHCWAVLVSYGGWAACFGFVTCWLLWLLRPKATAPVRFGRVYRHMICRAMRQYRAEHGTAKFASLFLAAGFPGLFPGFWLERADVQFYLLPARLQLQMSWVGIRCFSVIVTVHWCSTTIYSGVLSDARPLFDTISGCVFGTSLLLFMGILPSAGRRRRAMAFLRRLAQTVEEGEATTIGSLIGRIDASRAFEYATQTFRVVDGHGLEAADFGESSYDVMISRESRAHAGFLDSRRTRHVDLGECDAFISHSWRENGTEQWHSVMQWMSTFEASMGHPPTFWIDSLCLNQQHIDQSLAALPLYLAGCQQLVVLYGLSFPSRLWCIMELCARASPHALRTAPPHLRPSSRMKLGAAIGLLGPCRYTLAPCLDTRMTVSQHPVPDSADTFLKMGASLERVTITPIGSFTSHQTLSSIEHLDVLHADCHFEQDKQRLLGIIETGFGTFDAFNRTVRCLLIARVNTQMLIDCDELVSASRA